MIRSKQLKTLYDYFYQIEEQKYLCETTIEGQNKIYESWERLVNVLEYIDNEIEIQGFKYCVELCAADTMYSLHENLNQLYGKSYLNSYFEIEPAAVWLDFNSFIFTKSEELAVEIKLRFG